MAPPVLHQQGPEKVSLDQQASRNLYGRFVNFSSESQRRFKTYLPKGGADEIVNIKEIV